MSALLRSRGIRAYRLIRSILILVFVLSMLSIPATVSLAQSCPAAPASYTHGELTVYEGALTSGTGDASLAGDPSVAMDRPGTGAARCIVALETGLSGDNLNNNIVIVGFTGPNDSSPGSCIKGPKVISRPYIDPNPEIIYMTEHQAPSIFMAGDALFRVGWWVTVPRQFFAENEFLINLSVIAENYNFNNDPSMWTVTPPPPIPSNRGVEPSVGIADASADVFADGFARKYYNSSTDGLRYRYKTGGDETVEVCPGYPNANQCFYRSFQWQPCLSMRDDGYHVYCYVHPKNDYNDVPPSDIYLQLYDPTGTAVGSPIAVNTTGIDPPIQDVDAILSSPSVSFDNVSPSANSPAHIVVVWAGPELLSCTTSGNVYARVFQWTGGTNVPAAVAIPFVVNNDAAFVPSTFNAFPTGGINPSVALSTANNFRYIIAWNSQPAAGGHDQVHAQYFDGLRPLGREFRVNQDTSQPESGTPLVRRVANSAQHTVAYGPQDEVVCVWSVLEDDSTDSIPDADPEKAYYTMLPSGFADYLDLLYGCKGDVNLDSLINGLDIQPFIQILLGQVNCFNVVQLNDADVDGSGSVDLDDIPPFVTLLLEGATCPSGAPSRGMADCNANEIPDANDIADGTSQDCNANFIPDECDIDTNDPDGDGLVSADVNANGVPDECEPDCNHNSVPDAWDISQSTSYDVNSNGIPDECDPDCNANGRPDVADIACGGGNTCNGIAGSYDCNLNGTPDECEQDCNENGVPDDCDIDPSDPDGDTFVSEDCNANGNPDECDLALAPPFGSFDCNENGVPDECDIADETSLDENENGIPDECEEGESFGENSMMGTTGETPVPQDSGVGQTDVGQQSDGQQGEDQDAAWQTFYEWSFAQCWGPNCEASLSEQFQAYVDKLAELGLPVMGTQGSP